MVQPRAGVRLPLHPRRARGGGARDVHPRPPHARQGTDGRARRHDRRLGPARGHRSVRLGGPAPRVRALDLRQRHRDRPLGQLLPARRDRAAPFAGSEDGRPLRLGDVRRRRRSAGQGGLRRPLLDDPLRAGALRLDGHRLPLRPVGPAQGAPRRRRRRPRRRTAGSRRPGQVLLPGRPARSPQAAQGGRRGLPRREGRQPAVDLQGPARAPHELPREGRRRGPADRARDRRHGDRGAPAPVRRLRRLPRPEPLGGPRPLPLRGGRLRDAADHQRQPADERGGPRRRQRHPHRRRARRRRALRHPLDAARTSRR